MQYSAEEIEQMNQAVRWVRHHNREIIETFAAEQVYLPDAEPVSIFMAGTPGAGKTEYSDRLNKSFQSKAVRIDADEVRKMIDGYMGSNSYIFQRACTEAVNNIFGHALKHSQNLILDGTFAYKNALENIERSLKKNRKVILYFIYQDPQKAWEVTKAREAEEGRRVHKEMFIDAYIQSRENVLQAKTHYQEKIELNLVIKEYPHTGSEKVVLNIESIDGHLAKVYTQEELERLII